MHRVLSGVNFFFLGEPWYLYVCMHVSHKHTFYSNYTLYKWSYNPFMAVFVHHSAGYIILCGESSPPDRTQAQTVCVSVRNSLLLSVVHYCVWLNYASMYSRVSEQSTLRGWHKIELDDLFFVQFSLFGRLWMYCRNYAGNISCVIYRGVVYCVLTRERPLSEVSLYFVLK